MVTGAIGAHMEIVVRNAVVEFENDLGIVTTPLHRGVEKRAVDSVR